jgi:hypothetical protein
MKQKFISELGLINDSCCTGEIVHALGSIYKKTADTAYFQNEVFWALANLKNHRILCNAEKPAAAGSAFV